MHLADALGLAPLPPLPQLLMLVAPNIALVLTSTFVRSMGEPGGWWWRLGPGWRCSCGGAWPGLAGWRGHMYAGPL